MCYFFLGATCVMLTILQGCSPTFNWRDVRIDQTPLVALFPCQPDQGNRVVTLGAQEVTMFMWGCDAGGATFTVAYADAKDVANTGAVLGQWKTATLGAMRAQSPSELPYPIKGANGLVQSVQVRANGVRPDGTPVAAQAVWFAVDTKVYQAVVYADAVNVVAMDTYFEGLRLQ